MMMNHYKRSQRLPNKLMKPKSPKQEEKDMMYGLERSILLMLDKEIHRDKDPDIADPRRVKSKYSSNPDPSQRSSKAESYNVYNDLSIHSELGLQSDEVDEDDAELESPPTQGR